jgi:two-component system sensor histidine kinase RpfC
VLAAIILWPGVSQLRRNVSCVLDVVTVTWCLVHFEERGAPLFLVYVWVTLANGFRFGAKQLLIALVCSAAGFAYALWQSEFWRSHQGVGLGLLFGLVLLSLYVRKLVTQLFDALERAEAANLAKRRFISVVSHEMRTPLNAIIGMADLLRDTTLNREQADMLQTLRSSSRVMLSQIEDVLDFSKIEAGRLVLEKMDFDLHALVNSTCRIVASQAGAKGLEFVVSIMPEVPPALRGDPHHLRQILINLAGNSVKFTERGSVTVHVSAQSEGERAVRLKFSVRDTGIGIPPEAQAKIFESFTQADQSTTRRFGGSGLGTTIAKQLVELMRGRIGLESAVGLGTTFWFEVELDKQPERAAVGLGELAGARMLLIGFPSTERETLEQALASWGGVSVAVATVEDGLERLDAEISLARPYHSVLVYAADGDLQAAQRMRTVAAQPGPPVILTAARGAGISRFAALSAGFSAVLELPFEKRQLFNVLHSVSAAEETREGVVRLEDYARRGLGARKLRVLVADDNPTNREVLGKILQRAGHAATLVADGERALDELERGRYEVVLLDRNMPGMGGLEVLQALRLMSGTRERIPVGILSADATAETRRECLEAGADVFLSKPIEAARLLEELHRLGAMPPKAEHARAGEPAWPRATREGAAAPMEAVNRQTLSDLEELGSSGEFLEKLVAIFVDDNAALLRRLESAHAARNYHELRSALHAMKGSSASMGTDRLTAVCGVLGSLSDPELRLKGSALLRELSDELASARTELEHYLRDKRRFAG